MSDAELTWDALVRLRPTHAAALLAEQLEAEPSAATQTLIDRWIAHSEENRIAWIKLRDAWDVFEGWETDPNLVRQRREAVSHSFRARRPEWRSLTRIAAAAAIIVVGGATFRMLGGDPARQDDDRAPTSFFGAPDLVVADGSRRVSVLPDGTRVLLSHGAALDLAFTDDARLIRIERGEATFDVAKDGRRLFRVAVGNHVISDAGTVFTVRRHEGGMRVHLAKGRVKVTRGKLDQPSATPGIEMLPGQTLEATPTGERILTPPSARVSAVAAPAMDRMVFRDQSLASAVDQFNRTSRIKLETDPRIGEFRIRGSFRTGDGARFARALAQLYPIRVERRADGALLLLPHTDK